VGQNIKTKLRDFSENGKPYYKNSKMTKIILRKAKRTLV